MISFWVPGIPQPGGSKRAFVRGGRAVVVEDCKRNKDWRSVVALAAREAHSGEPLTGPVKFIVHFYLPRPKGHFRTGKHSALVRNSAPHFPTTKPDTTKLLRSTEDALSGILWTDDSQVVRQVASKHYTGGEAGQPGAWIEVKEATL